MPVPLRLLVLDSPAGLKQLVETHRPNVVVVHGAPSLARWRSHCAALARDAAMVVVGGGRTTGGTLVLSDLGVDVEAQRELSLSRGPRPPGALLASMRRLGAPFVLVAGRDASGPKLDDAVVGLDPNRPPVVTALAGTSVAADERLGASSQPVTGGVLVELALVTV